MFCLCSFQKAFHGDVKKIALVLGNQVWLNYTVPASLPSQTVERIQFTLASTWRMKIVGMFCSWSRTELTSAGLEAELLREWNSWAASTKQRIIPLAMAVPIHINLFICKYSWQLLFLICLRLSVHLLIPLAQEDSCLPDSVCVFSPGSSLAK